MSEDAVPAAPAAAPSPGPTRFSGVMAAALCLGTALVGGAGGAWWSESRLQAELTMRPPLIVMDYAPLAAALGQGTAPEILQAGFAAYKARAARFQEAGFLVLTRVAVEAMPEGMLIPPPEVLPAAAGGPLPRPAPLSGPTPGSPARSLSMPYVIPAGPSPSLPAPDQLRPAPPTALGQAETMSREEATALLRGLLGAGAR